VTTTLAAQWSAARKSATSGERTRNDHFALQEVERLGDDACLTTTNEHLASSWVIDKVGHQHRKHFWLSVQIFERSKLSGTTVPGQRRIADDRRGEGKRWQGWITH
jgi:hypothetical protein